MPQQKALDTNLPMRLNYLQKAAFKHFPELHSFALSNVASVDTREALLKQFESLK